ncbi:hypothetical protein SAMN05216326_11150 [Nitrosomonas marina]|uniref:Uncharacterized protein n=1 Tax=Nitrosomonas marina TaxID=917 RepID=A0A1I0BN03_9PROT|nr:DUF5995 family protein [Nitrosomonas marina]SET08001.1 hypothetical protein SAMN05216326_11150 [Nitrosomonas marina]
MFTTAFPDSISKPASSINGAIEQINHIISWSKQNNSRIGYFAALYRQILEQTKISIEQNMFENDLRITRLTVIFANRYIQACFQYLTGQQSTQSWLAAFQETQHWRPIVLQHLLLGMNAHINLDLGIAVVDTVPVSELPDMKNDFDKINVVLASQVEEVQQKLARIWPLLRLLNSVVAEADDIVINFSMEKAREAAWSFAESLAPLSEELRAQEIMKKDQVVAMFSEVISRPGFAKSFACFMIRLGERGTIRQHIGVLE